MATATLHLEQAVRSAFVTGSTLYDITAVSPIGRCEVHRSSAGKSRVQALLVASIAFAMQWTRTIYLAQSALAE